MPLFNVVAWFDPPVNERRYASTKDPRAEIVSAATPEAAARMWLWRLSAIERDATVRLTIWPRERKGPNLPVYEGPAISYVRRQGQLIEIERKPWPPPGRQRRA